MILDVSIDFETKSEADLLRVGPAVYAEHPSTRVICMNYEIWHGDEFVSEGRLWLDGLDPRDSTEVLRLPEELYLAIMNGARVHAFNAAFERMIWARIIVEIFGWVKILDHQWRDTQASAAYRAMPLKLEKALKACGLKGKDPEGERLISKYSKLYLKTAKREIPEEDKPKWLKYCGDDVSAEVELGDLLGPLPDQEIPIYQLDQRMNTRGLFLDKPALLQARELVAQREKELVGQFHDLVGYNPSQWDKVMGWFAGRGVELENMQADYIEEYVGENAAALRSTDPEVLDALQLKVRVGKAGTRKIDAMLRYICRDGRARFQTRYHGTQTGRNSGSGFQPLNMNKWDDGPDPDQVIRDIMYGDAEYIEMLYGDLVQTIANCARFFIRAEDGNKLVAGDFVSVEAVILACMAGEEWKIEAFRAGAKIYEMMAEKIYKLPPGTVSKKTHPLERQDGKTAELAAGYQGALGAWRKFDSSDRHSDDAVKEIINKWRDEHPATVALWGGIEDAAFEAMYSGYGEYYGWTGERIAFEVDRPWLRMILPNEKRIHYFDPQVREWMPGWHRPDQNEDCASGDCDCKPQATITYMAQKEGQWRRVGTYGGKLTENAIQAISRERLYPSILAAEREGYDPILTVYDEGVFEVPEDFGSKKELEEIMSVNPEWCASWPISCDAWEGLRYRK